MLGGSHSYGLNTPTSDIDERFLYVHDTIEDIVGLNKNVFIDNRSKVEDVYGSELKHFVLNLQRGNTQAIEMLYTHPKNFIEVHPVFMNKIQRKSYYFIDADKLYNSLRGYTYNELRLANGERTGDLGSKRKEALDKFGFSPKNFSHLLRLLHCGIAFFNFNDYPVNIMKYSKEIGEHLLDIKLNPQNHTKEKLNKEVQELSDRFEQVWKNNKEPLVEQYCFNADKVNQILYDIYYPILGKIGAMKLGL